MSNINEVERLFKRAVLAHLSEEELEAYHDNTVDEIDRSRIEAHLGRCLICERRLAMIQEAMAAYPQELVTEKDTGRVKAFLLHDAVASLESIGRLDSTAVTAEILAHIARLLQDFSSHVRREAVEAVGKIGSAAATDEILSLLPRLLADEHSDVRKAAVEAVDKLGTVAATDDILSQLHRLLEDGDDDVRKAAAKTIDNLDDLLAEERETKIHIPDPVEIILEALREALREFVEWIRQRSRPVGLAGATSSAGLFEPQDGQTEDGALGWCIEEDESGDLIIRLDSYRMELAGVNLELKAGPKRKRVVLEPVADDQVGAEVTFTREERTEIPEDAQLTIDILNEN